MAMFYLENRPHAVSRDGVHIATQNHFDYICREGKYEKLNTEREDLVYKTSGNIPEWASSEKDYWVEAERHRRFNGRAYREVKMALQEELTLEENIELVEKFCDKMGISKNHAYTFAVHDKPAAFDTSHRNIHCHLMFDERIIEKSRYLNKDQYFLRYASDKEGNPTGGYKKDRYLVSKECTIDMRRVWAELVNEKFAEKGLDCRISEKTLKAQYYELKKAGKDIEAEYFNRTPAPHMGDMYRNPRNKKKISDFEKKLEKELENFTAEENPTFYDAPEEDKKTQKEVEEATATERKMMIFAADALMRRIAREIQQERKRLESMRESLEGSAIATEILDDYFRQPTVITAGDIEDVMAERVVGFKKAAAEQEGLYKSLQKQLLSDKLIAAKAEADVLPQGREIKENWTKAKQKKIRYDNELRTLDINRPDYGTFMAGCTAATNDFLRADNALWAYNCQLDKKAGEIKIRIAEIKKEQEEIVAKSKEAYRAWNYNKKQQAMYEERIEYMKQEFAEDYIVYSQDLPKILDRNIRLNGVTKVGTIPTLTFGNSTYHVLADKKTIFDPNRKTPVRGIREGDFIENGRVKVYEFDVVVEQRKTTSGKTYTALKAGHVRPTGETIPVYKAHNQMEYGIDRIARFPKAQKTVLGYATQQYLKDKASKLRAFAGKIADNPPRAKSKDNAINGQLINIQPTEDKRMETHDLYTEAERSMDSFAAGLKLGGRGR